MTPRERFLFHPESDQPFKLSRSKLELFIDCPRCFYLDRRRGIGRLSWPSLSLNTAVDALLKREFDVYRRNRTMPETLSISGIDAIPLDHPSLDDWRNPMRGVQSLHEPTSFLVYGAVDDLWIDPAGQVLVVDYKATSVEYDVGLKAGGSYVRQLEVYQWLLRRNGLPVSEKAYLLFANADRTKDAFNNVLSFTLTPVPVHGDSSWIEEALHEARLCLLRDTVPAAHPECEWCAYRDSARKVELEGLGGEAFQ